MYEKLAFTSLDRCNWCCLVGPMCNGYFHIVWVHIFDGMTLIQKTMKALGNYLFGSNEHYKQDILGMSQTTRRGNKKFCGSMTVHGYNAVYNTGHYWDKVAKKYQIDVNCHIRTRLPFIYQATSDPNAEYWQIVANHANAMHDYEAKTFPACSHK
jgi:hypothetical protein